jgi:hypothetical protein
MFKNGLLALYNEFSKALGCCWQNTNGLISAVINDFGLVLKY